jgi:hypothetical protein
MNITALLKLVWPLILVQLTFQIYALYDLVKHKKTRNLTPLIWGIIIVLGEIIGPAVYFVIGRSEG